jgi:hypothetical protein
MASWVCTWTCTAGRPVRCFADPMKPLRERVLTHFFTSQLLHGSQFWRVCPIPKIIEHPRPPERRKSYVPCAKTMRKATLPYAQIRTATTRSWIVGHEPAWPNGPSLCFSSCAKTTGMAMNRPSPRQPPSIVSAELLIQATLPKPQSLSRGFSRCRNSSSQSLGLLQTPARRRARRRNPSTNG